MNQNTTCTIYTIASDFDPLGDDAVPWIRSVRDILNKYSYPATKYQFVMTGGASDEMDAIDFIYARFPIMIGVTALVVTLLVGFVYKSVFLPIRQLITIALPISWVYGICYFVFQQGTFDSVFPVLSTVHALYWLTPVMTFSILVGLALDYDLFLFTRIFDFRKAGYNTVQSIQKGIRKTGSIITSAGVIMSVAFGGMLLSTSMAINQIGFVMCIAVLVDTFLVRTLLVPALMTAAASYNWWPMQVLPEDECTKLADDISGTVPSKFTSFFIVGIFV
jgi:uncharacterized membrane protein YdfJ with MMPL/SSD domain